MNDSPFKVVYYPKYPTPDKHISFSYYILFWAASVAAPQLRD